MGLIAAAVIAYLIGSIPFGLVLCFLFGYGDIRKIGSGNIGATNVLRVSNKWIALLTLILDSSKGAAAVLYVTSMSLLIDGFPSGINLPPYVPGISAGFFALLGHCFPVWLKFKGGKGVATTLGTLLAAVPWTGVLACVTWAIVAGFFRYSSLAALSALALAPVFTAIFYGPVPAAVNVMIALVVFWQHRENIQRLVKGTEPKIGEKK